ncbi:MAG: triose-phosphate isomerase [Paracoccaceae bacterium]
MRKLAAGNWKMNGTGDALVEIDVLSQAFPSPNCDVLICPPSTLLERLSRQAQDTAIKTGGQDAHTATSGAHTGDISASMLAEAGASYVILGHSERRADHEESNALIEAKTKAAWDAGLIAVVCVGETLEERESRRTIEVVGGQLQGSLPDGVTAENTVVAYEPVWAIGTGKVPTLEEIGAVHDDIRARLQSCFGETADGIRLLYGGSVKPSNASEIFAVSNVDGALVGGASLKAADFGGIISALETA